MIPVDKFLEETEGKPVFLYVYSYFDTVLNQFNTPQVEDKDPQFMATAIRSGLIKGTFKQEQAVGLQFVLLGKFDIKSGKFDLLTEPQILVDCDRFFTKEKEGNVN